MTDYRSTLILLLNFVEITLLNYFLSPARSASLQVTTYFNRDKYDNIFQIKKRLIVYTLRGYIHVNL